MTPEPLPCGPFTRQVELRRIRAPEFVRDDRQGVTYVVARGYEVAYDATLRFAGRAQLPIKARLHGELNQRMVIGDASGRPALMSGYVQGRVEIYNADGLPIFRGHYYDSRTLQALTGDEGLTPTGQAVVDHFENGFGEGAYAGHAFSMGAQLIRTDDGPLRGEGRGQID